MRRAIRHSRMAGRKPELYQKMFSQGGPGEELALIHLRVCATSRETTFSIDLWLTNPKPCYESRSMSGLSPWWQLARKGTRRRVTGWLINSEAEEKS